MTKQPPRADLAFGAVRWEKTRIILPSDGGGATALCAFGAPIDDPLSRRETPGTSVSDETSLPPPGHTRVGRE